jgi:hypothetical protein|tara:strand:- start:50 stop:631 length:582 start_codon:yes stop_codon:yes gene_type:complete
MSKKSRRRNKKILATLAALGGAAMLANRRRDNSIAANEAKEAGFGTEKDFKETIVTTPKVYQDSIMRGGKGVKAARVFPKLSVTKKGDVIRDGVNTGVGNKKTAFVGDKYIYQDGNPYTKGRFGTFAAKKQMERGALPPQLRAPRIKNPYQGSMSGLAEGDFAAKKGGRATKSGFKRKGAAKRGFGRAFKGGK